MATPITAQALLDGLINLAGLDEDKVRNLLGEKRSEISLNQLELILINQNVISLDRLLLLKGSITGHQVYDDSGIKVRRTLDSATVMAVGAFVLDRDPLTVAVVEDTEYNLEFLATQLATREFEIWMITASQFDVLYRQYYRDENVEQYEPAKDIYEILDEAVRRRASDIHLSVGEPPILRVDGSLVRLPRQPLVQEFFDLEAPRLVGQLSYESTSSSYDADAAYSYGESRFRVNVGADMRGSTIALRKIPTKVPTLDEIGLPMQVRQLCDLERGLVLVTGPTGSGKSTTLASMLAHIGLNYSKHIITLEDPIEFHIPAGRSVIHQRELFESFTSFPGGLRQALRQDPDVILVGELRDLETMKTALTAAETGHLVFGTLHTFDAPSTVARLVSSFPPEEQAQARAQIAYILKGIVAQTLLPRSSGQGRAAAFEIMLSTPAIKNNLSKLDGHQQLKQTMETAQRDGMQTMEISLADLVRSGTVREDDAYHAAPDKEAFSRRLHAN